MVGATTDPQSGGAGNGRISGLGAALNGPHPIAIACASRQPSVVITGDIGAQSSECTKVGATGALAPLKLEVGFIRGIIIPGQVNLRRRNDVGGQIAGRQEAILRQRQRRSRVDNAWPTACGCTVAATRERGYAELDNRQHLARRQVGFDGKEEGDDTGDMGGCHAGALIIGIAISNGAVCSRVKGRENAIGGGRTSVTTGGANFNCCAKVTIPGAATSTIRGAYRNDPITTGWLIAGSVII